MFQDTKHLVCSHHLNVYLTHADKFTLTQTTRLFEVLVKVMKMPLGFASLNPKEKKKKKGHVKLYGLFLQ